MAEPDTSQFRMADKLVSGQLVKIITDHRAAGMGYEAIARQLFADHDIDVTGNTLRRWARDLGLDADVA